MSQNRFASVGVALVLIVSCLRPAIGAPVAVTNYNWLQLPLNSVTASIGGGAGGGSGFGSPLDFRVGDPEWIPNATLTNSGAGTYFAQVTFDQARDVKTVTNEWYGAQGGIRRYTLQGSTDGVSFVDIGSKDYGSTQTGSNIVTTVTVTEGNYKAVRAVLNSGDYTYGGSAGRGGPGLLGFDVKGDGTVEDSKVNWAHQASFGTVASNNGLGFNSLGYTSGNIYDDDGIRTGNNPGNWDPGDFVQIDLNALRAPNQIVLVWDSVLKATFVNFQYSTDGTNFQTLTQFGSSAFGNFGGYVVYNVLQREMRYLRVTDAASANSFDLLNQVMVFGVPEPTSASLLAFGGLIMLRRRRH